MEKYVYTYIYIHILSDHRFLKTSCTDVGVLKFIDKNRELVDLSRVFRFIFWFFISIFTPPDLSYSPAAYNMSRTKGVGGSAYFARVQKRKSSDRVTLSRLRFTEHRCNGK